MQWLVELSQYKICYLQWVAIEGQAVANFIAEVTLSEEEEVCSEPNPSVNVSPKASYHASTWDLHVDGSSNDGDYGAGLILSLPELECLRIEYMLRLGFKAFNNEAEYEALWVA